MPTLHIVSYFACTDKFTNSFHAKYKPISSKKLAWTDNVETIMLPPFGEHNNWMICVSFEVLPKETNCFYFFASSTLNLLTAVLANSSRF